jgi:carboxypeptidase PM20D1
MIIMGIIFLSACSELPIPASVAQDTNISINKRAASKKLAGAIQFETTYSQQAMPNTAAFLAFHEYLTAAFPVAHEIMDKRTINELSMVYQWQGSDPSLKPIVFLSHQDVVPVDHPEKWDNAPFSGTIDDKYIHGRGSVDVKFGITGTLEAVELLYKTGFRPQRSLIFAFGHDEEIMGTRGGENIAAWMAENNIKAEFILDEGPAVIPGLIPGLEKPVAFVGVAARGNVYFNISHKGTGGHASFPPADSSIEIISAAISRANQHQFEQKITQALDWSLTYLAPHMPGLIEYVYRHNGLFSPIVLNEFSKSETGRTVIQNTLVATTFHSGDKDATVPSYAEATLAMGILPGETLESATTLLKEIISDPRVVIGYVRFPDNQRIHAYDPTPVSPVDHWAYHTISKTIAQVFPQAAIAPTLMPGGSDGKHYLKAGVTDKVYHFFPIDVSETEIMSMHADNEKLPISAYVHSIQFYAQLIKNVQSSY